MSDAELHADGPDLTRRRLTQATAATGGLAIAGASVPFVASLAPSERARAQGAPVEADVSRIGPAELATFEWRGKPVWILRRTPDLLERLQAAAGELSDPPAAARHQQRAEDAGLGAAALVARHAAEDPRRIKSDPAAWYRANKLNSAVLWDYSRSTWAQRLPIIALGAVGFLIARELAAFQMGHSDFVWEPFFHLLPGLAGGRERHGKHHRKPRLVRR